MRIAIYLAAAWAIAGPAIAADPPKPEPKKGVPAAEIFEIPYRLTDTKHVLVRVKLNGKGPFNFILDTGAPAVFIPKKVAKKIDLETDDKGWGEFKSFQVEGGLTVDKARTRVEDLFQLEGMNGMGLAGVELHGVIGYNVLAKFKITYDFTQDKLAWEKIPGYSPPDPKAVGGKGEGQGGLEMMGTMMKTLAGFMGVKPNFEIRSTGFLGLQLEEAKQSVTVASVLKGGPADEAGIQKGDKLVSIKSVDVESLKDFDRAVGKLLAGDKVKVVVERKGEKSTLTLTLGKGL